MKIGLLATLAGGICVGALTGAYADETHLAATGGADGINVRLDSPVYSNEFSDPTAIPMEASLFVDVISDGQSGSISGVFEGRGSATSNAPPAFGEPALYEDIVEVSVLPSLH